jgi:hypothetical protein
MRHRLLHLLQVPTFLLLVAAACALSSRNEQQLTVVRARCSAFAFAL